MLPKASLPPVQVLSNQLLHKHHRAYIVFLGADTNVIRVGGFILAHSKLCFSCTVKPGSIGKERDKGAL